MPKIEIYTQPYCPYCVRALALLEQKGAAFTEISAPQGSDAREALKKLAGGRTSVPQTFINSQHIGGCDDLMALEASGKLDALLAS